MTPSKWPRLASDRQHQTQVESALESSRQTCRKAYQPRQVQPQADAHRENFMRIYQKSQKRSGAPRELLAAGAAVLAWRDTVAHRHDLFPQSVLTNLDAVLLAQSRPRTPKALLERLKTTPNRGRRCVADHMDAVRLALLRVSCALAAAAARVLCCNQSSRAGCSLSDLPVRACAHGHGQCALYMYCTVVRACS